MFLVVTSRTTVSLDDPTLTDPKLCVFPTDWGALPIWLGPTASDAAWGAVPGSTPVPQRDTTAPTLTFSFTPKSGPGGWFLRTPDVDVTAIDDVGISSIRCTYDGQWVPAMDPVPVDHGLRAHFDLGGSANDWPLVECSATDIAGNNGLLSASIYLVEGWTTGSVSGTGWIVSGSHERRRPSRHRRDDQGPLFGHREVQERRCDDADGLVQLHVR
jgi:hypothetical protein